MARTPDVIFSASNEPGAKWRSPAPMPPPRFSSGTVSLKFSRRFVVWKSRCATISISHSAAGVSRKHSSRDQWAPARVLCDQYAGCNPLQRHHGINPRICLRRGNSQFACELPAPHCLASRKSEQAAAAVAFNLPTPRPLSSNVTGFASLLATSISLGIHSGLPLITHFIHRQPANQQVKRIIIGRSGAGARNCIPQADRGREQRGELRLHSIESVEALGRLKATAASGLLQHFWMRDKCGAGSSQATASCRGASIFAD